MNKYIRLGLKVLTILLLLLVVLFFAAYIYVSANKKKIIAQVTQDFSNKINGEVQIKNADISFLRSFPHISVHAQAVSITDSMFRVHKHPFLSAEELFLNLSIPNLITKKSPIKGIRVVRGNIFLYTDTLGYTNTYLMQSKKDPAGGPKTTTKNITLQNVLLQDLRFIVLNQKKKKYHDFIIKELDLDLNDEGDDLVMKTKADMLVKSLAFNFTRGTYLQNAGFNGKFKVIYTKTNQVIRFNDITVRLAGHPYLLTGSFDLGDKNPAFTLKLKTKNVLYASVKKLLPLRMDSALSKVSVTEPINAEADLNGPLRGGEAYITVRWNANDVTLKTMFMDFEHASFSGYFKNEVVKGLPRKDPNSVISIHNFTADWHGLKVSADSINILNLRNPWLTCNLRSAFPLTDLNRLLNSESIKLSEGQASVKLSYSGPVEKNNNTNSFLNGTVHFKNGKILYAPRNVLMTNVNGNLVFNNSNLNIENIQCKVLGNDIIMNGTAANLLTLMHTDPNKVSIRYNIYSPSLNLASFTYLLKSRTPVKRVQKNSLENISNKIDEVLEKGRIEVDLKADKLLYHELSATNLLAGITILQDRYVLDRVNMNLADGSMAMKGQLLNVQHNLHNANVTAALQNVDVQKLFYAFRNFGQDGITDKHLEGTLSTDVNLSLQINDESKILPHSPNGEINFSLKNGALNNFEPLKKMQRFIFKNRDFDNIRFAELKNKFTIRNGEIQVNRMEIQSNVISFFVEGLYSPFGNTDLSIQVPFNNIKKRGNDYKPENVGVDKRGGRGIFLRGQPGDDGKIKFKLDLFKRYQSENGDSTTMRK